MFDHSFITINISCLSLFHKKNYDVYDFEWFAFLCPDLDYDFSLNNATLGAPKNSMCPYLARLKDMWSSSVLKKRKMRWNESWTGQDLLLLKRTEMQQRFVTYRVWKESLILTMTRAKELLQTEIGDGWVQEWRHVHWIVSGLSCHVFTSASSHTVFTVS